MPSHLIAGAGLRGLLTALEHVNSPPLLVDALPRPGGSTRTARRHGFSCELGRFAFRAEEIDPILARLPSAPEPVPAATPSGHVFDGARLVEVALDELPLSFRSGCEELVQACRRSLAPSLRLGRSIERIRPLDDEGWEIELGGESPTTLTVDRLTLCLPVDVAAELFADLDPALDEIRRYLVREAHAFAFLGGPESDGLDLLGYGIVPAADVDSPVAETIFCTRAFPSHGTPGRFLIRSEIVGEAAEGDEASILGAARAELSRQTGRGTDLPFSMVHRFTRLRRDAAWVECRARLDGIATRCENLSFE